MWPSNTTSVIDDIRGAIGRTVTFHVVASSYECPACGLDPVTGTAINSFCTVCSGNGIIAVLSGVEVSGHITWGFSELLGWKTGGQLDDGECRVQIKYTIANELLVDNSKFVTVDGREMLISKRILRGVPQINRILIDLIEKDKE